MRDWAWRGPERRAYTRREWVSATAASVLITPLTESAGATGAVPSPAARQRSPAADPISAEEHAARRRDPRPARAVSGHRLSHARVATRGAAEAGVPPAELVKTMDAVNLHTMVNLTGGAGEDLAGRRSPASTGRSPAGSCR